MNEQTNDFSRPRGKMNVYLCGGTGVNIAKDIKQAIAAANPSTIADVSLFLIDTSDSNLSATNKADQIYLFKDVDGGGKVRRAINELDMSRKTLEILERFPAAEFNVVINSLGGGSGSVIGPHLLREIIKSGGLAMAVGITNNDSKIEVDNTQKTFATYESISEKLGKPVVMAPFHNESPDKFDEINGMVGHLVVQLAALTSRQNAQLDTADVRNWLNYDRVTNVEPRLMGMYMTQGDAALPETVTPITTATLCMRGTNSRPSWRPDYQAVGFLPEGAKAEQAVHFTVADNVVQQVHDIIAKDAEALKKSTAARGLAKRIDTSRADDDGMVM